MNDLRRILAERMVTLLMAGLGFVAALAWNEAVQAVFQVVFPERGSITAKFIYAIFITMVITVVSLQVSKRAKISQP